MNQHLSKRLRRRRFLLGLACAIGSAAQAQAPAEPMNLSLEELLKTEVVTVSRRPQTLQTAAAAVFVIHREDIERSGATSIPEALRMVPGVQVARLSNNRWAVSARGFNGRFANKLQVLLDGRSIYSPLFAGVLWEAEDTLLEDIDRIEVIRGPGAAMWGTNAVNGVINIITRKSRDTQGTLLVAGAGTEERAFGAARHGTAAGNGHLRVWAKAFSRDESIDLDGRTGNDSWDAARAGFRGDWTLKGNRLTISGALHRGDVGDRWNIANVATPRGSVATDVEQPGTGAHLLARHEWALANGSSAVLQGYVDQSTVEVRNIIDQRRLSTGIDFQHSLHLGPDHELIWGLGWLNSRDKIDSQGIIRILPERRTLELASAFVHSETMLVPEQLRLSLGVRLEYSNFEAFHPQPNARLLWTPSSDQAVWGAISRAVRRPSRAERDALVAFSAVPANPPLPPILTRNVPREDHELRAERVTATEFGYRRQFGTRASVDLALFYNSFRDLRAASLGAHELVFAPVPHIVQNIEPNNQLRARSHGAELMFDWHVAEGWRLQPSYTYLHTRSTTSINDPVMQANADLIEGTAPRHQLSLRSSFSASARHHFDLWLRHASELKKTDQFGHAIAAYTTLDARYAWRPLTGLELALVGQNLPERRHSEFAPDYLPSQTMQIERGVYLKLRWQF